MNRQQIKNKRKTIERRIDRLMSQGYGGSEDETFKRACAECRILEKQLELLEAATKEINEKSTKTRRTNKYAAR